MKRHYFLPLAGLALVLGTWVWQRDSVSRPASSPAGASAHPSVPPAATVVVNPRKPMAQPGQGSVAGQPSGIPYRTYGGRSFPGAPVLASREEKRAGHAFHRVELLRTGLKYPFIRVETDLERDPVSGRETVLRVMEMAADHVTVQLRPGQTRAGLEAALASVHGSILKEMTFDYGQVFLVGLPEPTLDAVPEAVARLSGQTGVLDVAEPDGVQHLSTTPNDSQFYLQWSLSNPDGGFGGADVSAVPAWSVVTGSASVVVALSDSGINYNHEDLTANMWRNPGEVANDHLDNDGNGYVDDFRGYDFYDGDNNPADSDGADHATYVAGIIGARGNNGLGITGLSWQCKILPMRTLAVTGGFNSDIVAAYNYARAKGVKIINSSHGGYGYSGSMQTAVTALQKAGVLLVCAAGNEAYNTDGTPHYPSSYTNLNILSVGSIDYYGGESDFSNIGAKSVDLFAPGGDVYSTAAAGGYDYVSGTSFSAPHVSGVAALLLAQNPSWNYVQMRQVIMNAADVDPAYVGRTVSGGRLNAFNSVSRVTLGTALEDKFLVWKSGGNMPWVGQQAVTYDGVDAAQSGAITHNQESWLETTVSGPGVLNFTWAVSCEPEPKHKFDFLEFRVDNVVKAVIDGAGDWQEKQYTLGSGTHTLRWRYKKDVGVSTNYDRAWLDNVSYVGVAPTLTNAPVSRLLTLTSNLTLSVKAGGTPKLSYLWSKNGSPISGATNSSFKITGATPAHSGYYVVTVTNNWGVTSSIPALISVCDVAFSTNFVALPSGGGTGGVSFALSLGCDWGVTASNAAWLTLTSPTNGSADGVLAFTAEPNPTDAPRVAFLKVNNKLVTVYQEGVLVPSQAGGKAFTLKATNINGVIPTNGLSYLTLATVSNSFRLLSLSATNAAVAGSYVSVNDGTNLLVLTMSAGSDYYTAGLTFTSAVAGTYDLVCYVQGLDSNYVAAYLEAGTFNSGFAPRDLDGDGNGDLFLQTSKPSVASYLMNGTNVTKTVLLRKSTAITGLTAVGVGDFNADDQQDVLLRAANGALTAWFFNGTNYTTKSSLNSNKPPATGWKAQAAADFNNDGQADVLFQHDNGKLMVWLMDRTNLAGTVSLRDGLTAGSAWKVAGTGDFNHDRQRDLVMQHTNGAVALWLMVGKDLVSTVSLKSAPASTKVSAVADLNRDGEADLILKDSANVMSVWFLQGTNYQSSLKLRSGKAIPAGWRVFGAK